PRSPLACLCDMSRAFSFENRAAGRLALHPAITLSQRFLITGTPPYNFALFIHRRPPEPAQTATPRHGQDLRPPSHRAELVQHLGRSEEHTSELQSREKLVC